MDKISTFHFERKAYVYIRQSTMEQVRYNLESQRLQYGLVDHARGLGWTEVKVIDKDLGRSASEGEERVGFQQLLREVCEGEVGAIFALEASRLARNTSEWHKLVEFCAIVGTLIIDPQGIYDPKLPNDRLLLGIKGTLSEMEVSVFRERSQAARREKASRGELYTEIAVGYIRTEDEGLEKTPDKRCQEALELVFQRFKALGSMRQVVLWLQQEKILLPARLHCSEGSGVVWKVPGYATIRSILTNPVYAGAYVYGRRKALVSIENGLRRVVWRLRKKQEEWDICIKDHHSGYIEWEDYKANQETIAQNANMKGSIVMGSIRKGEALLSGLLRCGYCGRKAHVSYRGDKAHTISYFCRNTLRTSETRCGSFTERRIAGSISALVLESLSSLGVRASLETLKRQESELDAIRRQRELSLEQARYECERARRQYDRVEPENRLVASQLEQRWNQALCKIHQQEQELSLLSSTHTALTGQDKERFLALAQDLPAVWNHPRSCGEIKKRILRTIIKEVVVFVEERKIRLLVHWQGGDHSQLFVSKHRQYKTQPMAGDVDIIDLIKKLARIMPDRDIANLFNRVGYQTAAGHTWTQARVYSRRYDHDIPPYQDGERQARGEMNLSEASTMLNVPLRFLRDLIRQNILPAKQACTHAPWVILKCDLSSSAVEHAIENCKRRVPLFSECSQDSFNFIQLG